MENFDYYNPTRLINGKGKEKEIGTILSEDGISAVLILYGKNHIQKSGLLDETIKLLEENNIRYTLFGGVSSNPVLSHAQAAVIHAKKNKVNAILAIGGGSVVDEGKAIAVATKMDCEVWDLYTKTKAVGALPLYVILTLSATASEMNSGTVLTNEQTKEKFSFSSVHAFPKVSIVAPELTYSVPSNYFIYSAVDALSHVLEVYLTAETLPNIQKRFIENIILTVMETTERISADPKDYDARAEFSLAATWALNSLSTLGVKKYSFPNHMIEHSLSALYNVPHGAGLAVVIPAWMKWGEKKYRENLERLANNIFQLSTSLEAIVALENWFKKIGAPTRLADLLIDKNDIEKIADNAYLTSRRWRMTEIYSQKVITDILQLA